MTLLLAHWKVVAFALVVVALGVQTIRLQDLEDEYDYFRLEVAAAGREAKAKAEAIDAHRELVNEELQHDVEQARAERDRERQARGVTSDRFAALYRKHQQLLNADPGGGRVPEASDVAAAPVHASGRVCFDAERLISGIRASLGAFDTELEPLIRRGEDGLDDALHFGRWARLVGACPALPTR